jgi:Methyltransferase FkbM domain
MSSENQPKTTLVRRFRGSVHRILHAVSPALDYQVQKRFGRHCAENWRYRTKVVRSCPENALIPRVTDAGKVLDGCQIMHNGLKVAVGSYYGKGSVGLLRKNRGVHEPQEEYVFQEVLRRVSSGSAMIELGAYWAFYSMWFCKTVSAARSFLVEPMTENLKFGRKNFELNALQGHFTHAWVGERSGVGEKGVRVICVDDFMAEHRLERLAILHSDIQGAELDMLRGAAKTLREHRVDYCFVSTHAGDLHVKCEVLLQEHGFTTMVSVPPHESYSCDGTLVSQSPNAQPVSLARISRKPPY